MKKNIIHHENLKEQFENISNRILTIYNTGVKKYI